jgi:hypothetical protein
MRKSRFRSFVDDSWFVVVIMAAAVASAALDAGAVIDAMPSMLAQATTPAQTAASSIQVASRGALVARLSR